MERTHGILPATWRALTGGGGEHVYFSAPATEIRNSSGHLGPGLDIRGVGGYVVAPPSLHKSGRRYAWNVDFHPDECPLVPMPDWMLDRLARPTAKRGRPAEEWRTLVHKGAGNGCRNDTIAQLTGHLLRRNVDAHVTHDLMQAWNAVRCQPPLDGDEVTKVVASIAKKETARREAFFGNR
jgi:hypothetical protein